jgi:hypothetical protein
MGFRIHAESARPARILIRNLNRLLWFVLPPLDLCLGLATKGDPRQRALDRLAGTKVIHRLDKTWQAPEAPSPAKGSGEDEGKTAGESKVAPESKPAAQERCRECGGPLLMLDDQKFQCEECGAMQ